MIRLLKEFRFIYLAKIKWHKYKIGKGLYAGARVRLWAKNSIIIGENFYIGRDSQIEADCIIGNDVIFGNRVAIVGKYDHNFQQIGTPIRHASEIRDPDFTWQDRLKPTIIEDDVWVGYGSIIMSGITIHQGSIIAAGSVVTKDVEPYSIYAGNPARKIKDRFENTHDLQQHISILSSSF
ncbi:hypothetical protein BWI97_19035 [Siphonobacter sp. BAB-5405]|nr:hypothetical protein BWI97_19035 [Siphonobacter sp. BAB-5405]